MRFAAIWLGLALLAGCAAPAPDAGGQGNLGVAISGQASIGVTTVIRN